MEGRVGKKNGENNNTSVEKIWVFIIIQKRKAFSYLQKLEQARKFQIWYLLQKELPKIKQLQQR